MSIHYNNQRKIFTLTTRSTTYQMRISDLGHLIHLYYGRKIEGTMEYLCVPRDCGFSPNPYQLRVERSWSMDLLPQEYSGSNTGDFRLSSLNLITDNGIRGVDLYYVRHEIRTGKYAIPAMPAAFDRDGEAETLSVTLKDPVTGLEAELLYGVYEQQDVITRAVHLTNNGTCTIHLEKAASLCLDIPFGKWDMLHFVGRHTMERQMERIPLMNGIQTVASRRGTSSHQHNPFVILCDKSATEDSGDCYGIMLVYSGNHRTDVEVDQSGSVRVVSGIHDEQFSWKLESGESFDTPEVLLTFTHQGFTPLSQNYHRFLKKNICRSKYTYARRPVLINNWEATYFDFDSDKILQIARQAKELGVEMLVLDDGWFGKRNDDNSGLGDWFVNKSKLPDGLEPLIAQINDMGLKFGLWVEPEMVNEDSELYRTHPDWAMMVPGREPAISRNQLVLDLSREDVVDWLYETLSGLLHRYHIEYIKWDMNRSISDVYSRILPPDQQGEVAHRYVLGLYRLLDRLTTEFPDVLFEGCSGGGGRFDAAMLAYSPQIWCSDNTDAIERLSIQYGTSFGYPIASMGSHVSACPNHQTGRNVPLGTRAVVAMAGTFGYEMDLNKLKDEEKQQVRQQIKQFHEYYDLIQNGDYYRLDCGEENHYFTAWQFVAPDQSEALVSIVVTHPRLNLNSICLRLKGLDPEACYVVDRQEFFGCDVPKNRIPMGDSGKTKQSYSGTVLMYGGYVLPQMFGDYPSVQIYLKKEL